MRQGLRALDLRDGRDLVAAGQSIEGSTPFAQIVPVLYERECHEIHPLLHCDPHVGEVLGPEDPPPEDAPAAEEASVGGDGAAMHDSGGDVPVTGGSTTNSTEPSPSNSGSPGRAALADPGSETEARPMPPTAPEVSKVHRSPSTTEKWDSFRSRQTNLWALKVGHDRDRGVRLPGHPRTVRRVRRCSSSVPWEKFSRKPLTTGSIRPRTAAEALAGPTVTNLGPTHGRRDPSE